MSTHSESEENNNRRATLSWWRGTARTEGRLEKHAQEITISKHLAGVNVNVWQNAQLFGQLLFLWLE